MRAYTPQTITDAVIEQMSTTPDPRMKEVMEAAVRHLHAFAREVNLTPAEWIKGIEFMTKVGQACTPARQEFILLSDTMGLSALVNIMHDKTKMEEATGASLLGPFFRENTPKFETGAQIAKKTDGSEVVLFGRISQRSGRAAGERPGDGVADGRRRPLRHPEGHRGDRLPRHLQNRRQGQLFHPHRAASRLFHPAGRSRRPDGGESRSAQGMRPAHIHFLISAPGYRELVTALYIDSDERLENDVVFGASGDLVAEIKDSNPASPVKGVPSIHFDFRLARESEADRRAGRVGGDPGAITAGNGRATAPYGAPPPEMVAAAAEPKKSGIFGGLFRGR